MLGSRVMLADDGGGAAAAAAAVRAGRAGAGLPRAAAVEERLHGVIELSAFSVAFVFLLCRHLCSMWGLYPL